MMKFHAVKTLSEGIQDSRGLQKSFSVLLATQSQNCDPGYTISFRLS